MNPRDFRDTLNKLDPIDEARGRNRDIRVGDSVRGIMGVDGGKSGVVVKIGGPFSTSGAATVYVTSREGDWDTYDFNVRKVNEVVEGESDDRAAQLEHEYTSIQDGIYEFQEIQGELFQLKERLSDAIRSYASDSYQSWKSYGLAQLDIIAGGDEYASHDESINNLIEDLEGNMQDIRDELEELRGQTGVEGELVDDVDRGTPLRKRRGF